MVKDGISLQMVKRKKENGKKEKEADGLMMESNE